jgi:hypothetical protein
MTRRNSLKHGFTGEGIVLPNEDAEALEARLAGFVAVFQPTDEVELELVKRYALMAIRLDRRARQSAKAISIRMRNAGSEFDDARMAEADHLISWIAHEPVTNNRRLKRSIAGLTLLIAAIDGLRANLTRQPGTAGIINTVTSFTTTSGSVVKRCRSREFAT